MHLQTLILTCIFSLLALSARSSQNDYARLLSDDWNRASKCMAEHEQEWNMVFDEFDVDARECRAVVYPELLRYSHLRDYIEQAAVRALYVQYGRQKADFSIGLFQMKPSFAEEIETAWMKSEMRHKYRLYFDCGDTVQSRSTRIKRLAESRWQCVYLAVFVRLMLERETMLTSLTASERIRLLSTAYNVGFHASMKELQVLQNHCGFYLDFIPTKNTVYYTYSDMAVEAFVRSN